MIISFPSSLQKFVMTQMALKGQAIHYAHTIGCNFVFTPPIELKPYDFIWIDTRNGKVEIIERAGIAIYRSGWMN